MMKTVQTVAEWRQLHATYSTAGKSIGVIPTMGALHDGHVSLLAKALRECDVVVVTLFVNPTQFDESTDFENYPRTNEADREKMTTAGVDVVFVPSVAEMYPNGSDYSLQEDEFSRDLCGAHRPGHFTGVLTVVMKLLQIIGADRAYFGEKDYQQLELIRGMTKAFFLETEIVPCPTIREPDGLAMSSRNVSLSSEERALAPQFYAILKSAPDAAMAEQQLRALGFVVDYIEDKTDRRFGAVRLGSTRLIDNVSR
jgi:pantoate--beta-alanine ligase